MKTETMALVSKINKMHGSVDSWFVVEKEEKSGWVFKYYLLLYNPQREAFDQCNVSFDEYCSARLESVVDQSFGAA